MSAPSTIGSSPSPIAVVANQESNDVYWTSHDPRDSGIIGYEGARPVFWRLATTMAYHNATRTIVFKGAGESSREEEVAWSVSQSIPNLTACVNSFISTGSTGRR
ncbi:hypothetical protein ACGC1H_004771 [Rhizoctonia solani]